MVWSNMRDLNARTSFLLLYFVRFFFLFIRIPIFRRFYALHWFWFWMAFLPRTIWTRCRNWSHRGIHLKQDCWMFRSQDMVFSQSEHLIVLISCILAWYLANVFSDLSVLRILMLSSCLLSCVQTWNFFKVPVAACAWEHWNNTVQAMARDRPLHF